MKKPECELDSLSFGKILQIDPMGKDPIQVMYGGDFLISCAYSDKGVTGYLASVSDQTGHQRSLDRIYLTIDWKYLTCVGSVEWFNQIEEKNGEKNSDSNKD